MTNPSIQLANPIKLSTPTPTYPKDADLLRRAFRAYFRSGDHDQPSSASDVRTASGRIYVVLHNVNGILAVYRVKSEGRLKRLPNSAYDCTVSRAQP